MANYGRHVRREYRTVALRIIRITDSELYEKSLHKSITRLVALAVSMGLLLFAPAGTAQYWQAWLYLGIFTGASLLTTLYLLKKDPRFSSGA